MDFFTPRLSNPRPKLFNYRYRHLVQRRITALDHLHPHRWNWAAIVRPLDSSLEQGAQHPISRDMRLGLRYLWLQGLFNAAGDNFYLSFIPLFVLAYEIGRAHV